MAYGRRKFFKRRRFIRRTGRFRRTVGRIARRTAYNLAETKFLLGNIATIIEGPPINYVVGAGLAQGNTAVDRIGQQVRVKNISMMWRFFFNRGSGGRQYADVRMTIIYPRKGLSNADMASIVSSMTLHNRPDPTQCIVIKDKRWHLVAYDANSTAFSGQGTNTIFYRYRFKKPRYVFNYSASNGTQPTRTPIIVFTSNINAGDASDLNLNGYLSMSFKDI